MSVSGTARRFVLRERTAAAHHALEAAVGPIDSPNGYLRYMCGLYAFRAPIEAAFSDVTWPHAYGAWRPVCIAELLQRDIADLGGDTPPAAKDLMPIVDASALAGRLYVLEGSALGAQLLRAQAMALGFDAAHGARHLARQADTLDNWKQFIAIMEQDDTLDITRAGDAADATFATARRCFGDAYVVC